MKILVVEDEMNLALALKEILEEQKYKVTLAFDGADGLEYGLYGDYDLLVLDGMLPKLDGFDLIKKLRAARIQTPAIMLTARDDIRDKIKGLDSGADDYMTKPFLPEELLARIRALTRRQGEIVQDELQFGDLVLNLSNSVLRCKEKEINVSFKELEILKLLFSNQKTVLSKDVLLSKVWGDENDADYNNVEAYISFLRKKLDFLSSGVSIKVLRKLGYRLEFED